MFFNKLILTFILLILSGNVEFSLARCSYTNEIHQHGQDISKKIHTFGDTLLNQGYLLNENDPGYNFFQEASINNVKSEMFRRSMTLIYTEQQYRQFHIKTLNDTNLSIRENLRSLTECIPLEDRCDTTKIHCISSEKYRTYSGVCNNLENPKYGATATVYSNILRPCYDDDFHTFRKSYKKRNDLPIPRKIGQVLFKTGLFEKLRSSKSSVPNFFNIMFGQIITHDFGNLNLRQTDFGVPLMRCCPYDYSEMYPSSLLHPACAPITIPKDDEFYSKYGVTCQHFLRTQTYFDHDCKIGYTKQLNSVSQYLDNSNVYGNSKKTIQPLRTQLNGQIKKDENNILPQTENCSGRACYILGDGRLNQSPMLIILTSIFLRLHNRISVDLSKLNTTWNDEKIFQETRRICIGIYQNIVYEEWLPIYLGDNYSKQLNLTCEDDCGKYNSSINPMVLNEFQHGAFRIFHNYVPSTVLYYGEDDILIQNISISDTINNPDLFLGDHYNDLLRGMLVQPMNFGKFSDELRNKLFKANESHFGIDLLAYDIQRSRDHGVCPYYKYYNICVHDKNLTNWEDLGRFFSKDNIQKLKNIYESVFDIDLIVGIALEQKANGYLGVVGKCLIGRQFYNSKFGDRFFYTHENGPHPFTKIQLKEIRNFTMATLLCTVTNLKNVPVNAFKTPSYQNQKLNCTDLKTLNLNYFVNTK